MFRYLSLAITTLVLIMVLLFINQVINERIDSVKASTYSRVADNMKENLLSQLSDKRNGTFSIALGLSENPEIIDFLKTGKNPKDLRAFSRKLQKHTNYQDVWFQLVDSKGTSRYRTWTKKIGDSLLGKRLDVVEMIRSPHVINTISVGIFSMTFKSLVPVYKDDTFIGSLETITHFNSIDRNLKESGIRSVILVDRSYHSQLTRSLTGDFIDGYYRVNTDPDPTLLAKIKRDGPARYLGIKNYLFDNECIITCHTIWDDADSPMGYFILSKRLDTIDMTSITSFEHSVKLAVPLGIIVIFTTLLLTVAVRRAREARKDAHILEERVQARTTELRELNRHLEDRVREETEKRHRQEQQLIAQEKLAAMGQMLTNISHHWRQPLNVLALNIQDFAEANEFGEMDDAYIRDNIARSMEQIRYMSDTIENFKHLFGENDKKPTRFSVREILQNIATLLEPELALAEVRLAYPDEDLHIVGMAGEFKQVLLNIINNAIDAIRNQERHDGMIRVSYDTDGEDVLIAVTDNGGGIDEAIMDKIFEPYFTTKFKSKGVGISLYMSKIIIENNMNGSCRIDNVPDGARFTIRIPRHYDA